MTRRRKILAAVLAVAAVPVLAGLLFVVNGLLLADGTSPRSGVVTGAVSAPARTPGEIRVMGFNVAKCFIYEGGVRFASRKEVAARLDRMCAIIREANPDILCLAEVAREGGPCDVDQVRYIAEHTGLANWAFGENFSFGLPFLRVVSGNAVLSRFPVRPVANISLAGRKPFYVTKNNRRALLCRVGADGAELHVWAIHNDSFNLTNNLAQVSQELAYEASADVVMAGDFNAWPGTAPIKALRESGRFSGVFDGPKTFPSDAPDRTIDFVLGPAAWRVMNHRVIVDTASDHCAVVTGFGQ